MTFTAGEVWSFPLSWDREDEAAGFGCPGITIIAGGSFGCPIRVYRLLSDIMGNRAVAHKQSMLDGVSDFNTWKTEVGISTFSLFYFPWCFFLVVLIAEFAFR